MTSNIQQVRIFAEKAHAGQKYDVHPYTFHLNHCALIAARFKQHDEAVRKALWLHDVLEDTDMTQEELRRVGVEDEVISIVECVTDGPGTNRKERKASMYPVCMANDKAVVVKLCDRIANVEANILLNSDKFKMYFREFPEFEKNLRTSGKMDDMWEYLNHLIHTVQ